MGLSKASPGPSTSSAAAPAPPSSAWLLPLSLLTLALVLAGDDVGAAGLLSAPPTEVLAVRSASGEPSASPRLCASAAEMTVGEWSSSEDGGGAKGDHADRFLPAGCRLVEPGFDADGSLCAQLAALRIDALVFLGDSLAANLMLDLREGFFGEMSTEESAANLAGRAERRTSCQPAAARAMTAKRAAELCASRGWTPRGPTISRRARIPARPPTLA